MTFRLGLTGSIGMGKSTTARMFAEEGCAVWDADDAVHRLYAPGGAAVSEIAEIFPEVIENGAVSRQRLRDLVTRDSAALPRIEAIVHPLVAREREEYANASEQDIIVFDIPLLFETKAEEGMDAVACVTAPEDIQRARVLGRKTMNETHFKTVLGKQMSDAEKCARADYVIVTDTLEHAREQVRAIIADIRRRLAHA